MPVEFFGKFRWILRFAAKFYKPFVVGEATIRIDLGSHRKFDDFGWKSGNGPVEGLFDFLPDDVFPESRNKMFDPSSHQQSVRIGADKPHRISQIISPQSGVAVEDQDVLYPCFYFIERYPPGIFLTKF